MFITALSALTSGVRFAHQQFSLIFYPKITLLICSHVRKNCIRIQTSGLSKHLSAMKSLINQRFTKMLLSGHEHYRLDVQGENAINPQNTHLSST